MPGTMTMERNEADLLATHRDWFWANLRRGWERRLLGYLGVIGLLIALGWALNRWVFDGLGWPLYGAAGGVVIAVPVCWTLYWLLLPKRTRRLFRQQRLADPRFTWRWSEAGLETEGANGNSRHAWDELHRWHPGKRSLMFFLHDAFVLYIPRHRLTPEQDAELQALAEAARVPRYC
jgi:hypothetical protein